MTKASRFWKKYRKDTTRLHLCNIPEEIFYARHRNVLKLIEQYEPLFRDWRHQSSKKFIGLLLSGKYYDDVWSSRSCSGYLAHLVGIDNWNSGAYITFYCGSSDYYTIITEKDLPKKYKRSVKKLVRDFNKADEQDNKMV